MCSAVFQLQDQVRVFRNKRVELRRLLLERPLDKPVAATSKGSRDAKNRNSNSRSSQHQHMKYTYPLNECSLTRPHAISKETIESSKIQGLSRIDLGPGI